MHMFIRRRKLFSDCFVRLSLGTDLDNDDEADKDSEEEWDDEEIKEQESF